MTWVHPTDESWSPGTVDMANTLLDLLVEQAGGQAAMTWTGKSGSFGAVAVCIAGTLAVAVRVDAGDEHISFGLRSVEDGDS